MATNLHKIMSAAALIALPALTQAQSTSHYGPGSEGIKGASLPPPGVYVRDYNIAYTSHGMNDRHGHEISEADAGAFVYANIPRVIWITETKVLGGYLGFDALLPLVYTSLEANTPMGHFDDITFGIGDVFAETTLSWHLKQFDFSAGVGMWMPTGDYSMENPTRAGLGYWGTMLTAGVTWYIDADKAWAVSALNRYEFNFENNESNITPGEAYTLEWGINRTFNKTLDVGVVGYYQQQVTADTWQDSNDRDRVAAIGPEVAMFYPKYMLGWSFRYLYEFMAENRLQGQTFSLTLTKRF